MIAVAESPERREVWRADWLSWLEGPDAASSDEAPPIPSRRTVAATALALGALSALEVAAHLWKGPAAVVAARLWVLHGTLAVGWLLSLLLATCAADLRRLRLWFLLPACLGVPLCFFAAAGFGDLNSESLSELQHAFEKLRQVDWGYVDVFWAVYPSRSFLPNMVPTLLTGIGPLAYRWGFSIPVFLGVLFFYAGLRRYHAGHPFAAALAGLASASVLVYPFVGSVTRTFEMAVSSLAYGLWAIGALLCCVAHPTFLGAAAAAWAIGLLAAAFTSGLALVALLWVCLALWLARSLWLRQARLVAMVASILLYVTVFAAAMYLVRTTPLRPNPATLSEMAQKFGQAVEMVLALTPSSPGAVFTPPLLVFPTLAAVGFALSLRGGLLPLAGVLWCLPALWATVNLHGKVSPQLPFVLYRAIVIVPVLVMCMLRLALLAIPPHGRPAGLWRGVCLALAAGLCLTALHSYTTLGVFRPRRAPMDAEVVIERLLGKLPDLGLTPFSDAVLLNRTGLYDLEHIAPFSWYFLPGWTRAESGQPAFFEDLVERRPGVVFALPGDSLIGTAPPGYAVRAETLSIPVSPQKTIEVVQLYYKPLVPIRPAEND